MLRDQAFGVHSLHSAEHPTASTVETDLLPTAPRATALVGSAAAALSPSGERGELNFPISKGITLKVITQIHAA